jgi:hypothetical protein
MPPLVMRTYVRMTSQRSPYARFQRALRIGRLPMVRAAAAELPRIDLHDALSICLLIERQDGERYERAVVRWLARMSVEVPTVGIDDLREGLVAFEALPHNPAAARQALASLCERHGLRRAAALLALAPRPPRPTGPTVAATPASSPRSAGPAAAVSPCDGGDAPR